MILSFILLALFASVLLFLRNALNIINNGSVWLAEINFPFRVIKQEICPFSHSNLIFPSSIEVVACVCVWKSFEWVVCKDPIIACKKTKKNKKKKSTIYLCMIRPIIGNSVASPFISYSAHVSSSLDKISDTKQGKNSTADSSVICRHMRGVFHGKKLQEGNFKRYLKEIFKPSKYWFFFVNFLINQPQENSLLHSNLISHLVAAPIKK